MIRRLLLGAVLLVAMLGVVAWNTEPPRLLSWLDAVAGGGRGVELVGNAIPFGTTGQALDVWRPAGDAAGKKRPVLIFFYGGGWVHGDRRSYAFAARAFAKAGYVVVVPDYRKVPGVRFPAFVQDAAMAVRWVRDNVGRYGGDVNRVALSGHSAGAYLAAMLTLDRRWLRAEGVDPAIIKAAVPMCAPLDFYPFNKRRSRDAMQGAADPAMTQPIHFARADAPPILLLHGTADTVVRVRNSRNLAAAIRAKGGAVHTIEFEGMGHAGVVMGLSRPFAQGGKVLDPLLAFMRAPEAVAANAPKRPASVPVQRQTR